MEYIINIEYMVDKYTTNIKIDTISLFAGNLVIFNGKISFNNSLLMLMHSSSTIEL